MNIDNPALAETAPTNVRNNVPAGHRILHELVLPEVVSPDIVPLYVESTVVRSAAHEASGGRNPAKAPAAERPPARVESFDAAQKMQRRSMGIPSSQMRSFGTYFNAFPASYWRRWTRVRQVTLTIATQGRGHLIVNKTNARGDIQQLDSIEVHGESVSTFELSLDAFGDGGWIWFDAYAASKTLQVQGAAYSAHASLARSQGTFALAMTTMNKVDYAFNTIEKVAGNTDLRRTLDTVYVVDQGSDRLRDYPERLSAVQQDLGSQLTLIEQGNIGGSGGYSRGLYEAATNGSTDYVITCDDDIILEPESVIRLVTFADFCTAPTLVGAHMFDINARSILHAFGETVDAWSTQPGRPHEEMTLRHDFAAFPLRSTAWLHRRVDVDYNGWWMCLIPTEVVRDIGLALPLFIKWDDSEYGLRAKAAGYPTVSLPGAGIWHMAWTDKDDASDWQAYFHYRNRVITALLHSPFARGGGTMTNSQLIGLKHLLSMQYSTEAIRALAHNDILRGPATLHAEIGTKLPEIREITAAFADASLKSNIDEYPEVRMNRPPNKGRPMRYPRWWLLPLVTAKALTRQLLVEPRDTATANPETQLAFQDAKWWRLARFDSALVTNAGGTKVAWYRRDPKQTRAALSAELSGSFEILRRWEELRAAYRAEASNLTSFSEWEKTFANNPAPQRTESTT